MDDQLRTSSSHGLSESWWFEGAFSSNPQFSRRDFIPIHYLAPAKRRRNILSPFTKSFEPQQTGANSLPPQIVKSPLRIRATFSLFVLSVDWRVDLRKMRPNGVITIDFFPYRSWEGTSDGSKNLRLLMDVANSLSFYIFRFRHPGKRHHRRRNCTKCLGRSRLINAWCAANRHWFNHSFFPWSTWQIGSDRRGASG